MYLHDLREAQLRFETRISDILQTQEKLYQLRNDFVTYFDTDKIESMHIDDYVLGSKLSKSGYNFCYGIERQLDGLGRIIGATATKFGVYYGRTRKDGEYRYRFAGKYGKSYNEAFENTRNAILSLIKAGRTENLTEIINIPLSPMFKGKILSTYFPDRYLNIFSETHLDYYLTQLDLDTKAIFNKDAVYKREELLSFKNSDPIMKYWTIDLFATFLYSEYPGKPPKDNPTEITNDVLANDLLEAFKPPVFPSMPDPTFIELTIFPPEPVENKAIPKKTGKVDYEKQNRFNQRIGSRGEWIVMQLEEKRLINAGRKDLSEKVLRVSLKDDSFGYDIISYETDGKKRFIEVKATTASVGPANFYLTANELKIAQEIENYYIYMVYEIISKTPKVWAIKNPFIRKEEAIVMIPTNYKVIIDVLL